jgi:hypothetical protein
VKTRPACTGLSKISKKPSVAVTDRRERGAVVALDGGVDARAAGDVPDRHVRAEQPLHLNAGDEPRREAPIGGRRVEREQILGMRVGQRPEHRRVDRAEDGGRRADAHCERENGRHGEPGVPPHRTEAEPKVSQHGVGASIAPLDGGGVARELALVGRLLAYERIRKRG